MAVSTITGITQEDQPQELSSFLRAGVAYVVWATPLGGLTQRIRWKPHNSLDYTEVIPTLVHFYRNVSCIYDTVSDNLVVVWDDGLAVDGSANGQMYIARFNPVTADLVSGPTELFQGSRPKLSYLSTTQNANFLLYYKTAKNLGVYGRRSLNGGLTWQGAYPLITGQVSTSTAVEVVPYDGSYASIAQLGSNTRTLQEAGMFQRTRPLQSILSLGIPGAVGHVLDANTLALWRLDEAGTTWADATGSYPLTQTGSPVSVNARIGKGRQFTAASQYGSAASDAAARSQFTDGEWTIEFWFGVTNTEWATAPTNDLRVMSLQGDEVSGSADNALFGIKLNQPTRDIVLFSQSGSNIYQFGPPSIAPVSLDRWQHLAWRSKSDGAGTFDWTVFLNGTLIATRTLRVAPTGGGNATWRVGGTDALTSLRGILDDIRISKVARTDAEILASAQNVPFELFVGEPSKFDNTTIVDNLRGGLVASRRKTQLYHLGGVAQGTSDSIGAVARLSVTGPNLTLVGSAGPVGNGDDIVEYMINPTAPTGAGLSLDLAGSSFAVALDVSNSFSYVSEYADNSGVLGQFIVVSNGAGTSATVFSGVTGVRAVGVANFLSPVLIFVASTESGAERLRVYQENALTPTLLLNTKLTSRANAITVAVDPTNPTGALIYVSCVDRFNIYRYTSSSLPVQLIDSVTMPGGSNFFQSIQAPNGNVVVAAGATGVLVLTSDGTILAQTSVSGKIVQEWVPSKVYALNDKVRPRLTHQFSRSRFYFNASTAGTSGTAEPSWASTGTMLDNTAQWQPVGLVDGVAVGVAIDATNKRIYAVGVAGGVLGTDGRVWVINAMGLI